MRILGIADHINCGSAFVQDGDLSIAINDERLLRSKMVFGFPRQSIAKILEMADVTPDDVDAIAIATRNQHLIKSYIEFGGGRFGIDGGTYKQLLFEVAARISKWRRYLPFLDSLYYLIRQPAYVRRRWSLRRILRKEFGFHCPIFFLDHHYCHAAAAYFSSGYRQATVVTMDSAGDAKSCKVYSVADGEFKEMHSIPSFDSLAKLYSYVTQTCGFTASRHEGKITGLAAYGEPRFQEQLGRIITQQNGTLKNVANVYFRSALRELEQLLPADFSHVDLAASVQAHTEVLVTRLVEQWVKASGHRDLALAGGLFSNVKVNQRLHELDEIRSVYVYPAMSDEGLAAGAALALYSQLDGPSNGNRARPMRHVYIGPAFDGETIERELKRQNVEATHHAEVEVEIARLLATGAVVARFDGPMEYGPRALGNRSILYQATDPSVQHWMNEALKRTEFMPFAPIVLAEHAHLCFEHLSGAEDAAKFMTITFQCTPWMAEVAPGVVHVDGTARPQIVSAEENPGVHKILSEYHRMTGIPCLINTSFNMHEEPIVCTPSDAIRSFQSGNLDYLAIGNWIAKNPTPANRLVNTERLDFYLQRRGKVTK